MLAFAGEAVRELGQVLSESADDVRRMLGEEGGMN